MEGGPDVPFVRGFVILAGTVLAARACTTLASKLGGGRWAVCCADLTVGTVWGVIASVWVIRIPLKWSVVLALGFVLGQETRRWIECRQNRQSAG